MKKKICFVVSQPGTAISFLSSPMEKLKENFDIYLVANFKEKEEVEGLPLVGYKSIRIERRPKIGADLKALWQLYRYFCKENFFAVHSIASKPSLLTAISGTLARVPHRIRIFTGQIWCNMKGIRRLFFKTVDRLTVLLDTELLADGYPQARFLAEQKILKPNKIKVLANGSICGIDPDCFKMNLETRSRIRKEMNLDDKVVYVFLGRLKREKGIYELLAAFDKMMKNCPNSLLLLVGPDEENCREWTSKFSRIVDGENVIFYGYSSRPYDMLMASDVFCMPSYREGFGLSVLEASCIGLPVICSDIYGMEDTMVEGETGLRCKVNDVDSLAECMAKMYMNPSMRKEYGRNGHRRVVKDFSRDLVTEAWYNFYKELN